MPDKSPSQEAMRAAMAANPRPVDEGDGDTHQAPPVGGHADAQGGRVDDAHDNDGEGTVAGNTADTPRVIPKAEEAKSSKKPNKENAESYGQRIPQNLRKEIAEFMVGDAIVGKPGRLDMAIKLQGGSSALGNELDSLDRQLIHRFGENPKALKERIEAGSLSEQETALILHALYDDIMLTSYDAQKIAYKMGVFRNNRGWQKYLPLPSKVPVFQTRTGTKKTMGGEEIPRFESRLAEMYGKNYEKAFGETDDLSKSIKGLNNLRVKIEQELYGKPFHLFKPEFPYNAYKDGEFPTLLAGRSRMGIHAEVYTQIGQICEQKYQGRDVRNLSQQQRMMVFYEANQRAATITAKEIAQGMQSETPEQKGTKTIEEQIDAAYQAPSDKALNDAQAELAKATKEATAAKEKLDRIEIPLEAAKQATETANSQYEIAVSMLDTSEKEAQSLKDEISNLRNSKAADGLKPQDKIAEESKNKAHISDLSTKLSAVQTRIHEELKKKLELNAALELARKTQAKHQETADRVNLDQLKTTYGTKDLARIAAQEKVDEEQGENEKKHEDWKKTQEKKKEGLTQWNKAKSNYSQIFDRIYDRSSLHSENQFSNVMLSDRNRNVLKDSESNVTGSDSFKGAEQIRKLIFGPDSDPKLTREMVSDKVIATAISRIFNDQVAGIDLKNASIEQAITYLRDASRFQIGDMVRSIVNQGMLQAENGNPFMDPDGFFPVGEPPLRPTSPENPTASGSNGERVASLETRMTNLEDEVGEIGDKVDQIVGFLRANTGNNNNNGGLPPAPQPPAGPTVGSSADFSGENATFKTEGFRPAAPEPTSTPTPRTDNRIDLIDPDALGGTPAPLPPTPPPSGGGASPVPTPEPSPTVKPQIASGGGTAEATISTRSIKEKLPEEKVVGSVDFNPSNKYEFSWTLDGQHAVRGIFKEGELKLTYSPLSNYGPESAKPTSVEEMETIVPDFRSKLQTSIGNYVRELSEKDRMEMLGKEELNLGVINGINGESIRIKDGKLFIRQESTQTDKPLDEFYRQAPQEQVLVFQEMIGNGTIDILTEKSEQSNPPKSPTGTPPSNPVAPGSGAASEASFELTTPIIETFQDAKDKLPKIGDVGEIKMYPTAPNEFHFQWIHKETKIDGNIIDGAINLEMTINDGGKETKMTGALLQQAYILADFDRKSPGFMSKLQASFGNYILGQSEDQIAKDFGERHTLATILTTEGFSDIVAKKGKLEVEVLGLDNKKSSISLNELYSKLTPEEIRNAQEKIGQGVLELLRVISSPALRSPISPAIQPRGQAGSPQGIQTGIPTPIPARGQPDLPGGNLNIQADGKSPIRESGTPALSESFETSTAIGKVPAENAENKVFVEKNGLKWWQRKLPSGEVEKGHFNLANNQENLPETLEFSKGIRLEIANGHNAEIRITGGENIRLSKEQLKEIMNNSLQITLYDESYERWDKDFRLFDAEGKANFIDPSRAGKGYVHNLSIEEVISILQKSNEVIEKPAATNFVVGYPPQSPTTAQAPTDSSELLREETPVESAISTENKVFVEKNGLKWWQRKLPSGEVEAGKYALAVEQGTIPERIEIPEGVRLAILGNVEVKITGGKDVTISREDLESLNKLNPNILMTTMENQWWQQDARLFEEEGGKARVLDPKNPPQQRYDLTIAEALDIFKKSYEPKMEASIEKVAEMPMETDSAVLSVKEKLPTKEDIGEANLNPSDSNEFAWKLNNYLIHGVFNEGRLDIEYSPSAKSSFDLTTMEQLEDTIPEFKNKLAASLGNHILTLSDEQRVKIFGKENIVLGGVVHENNDVYDILLKDGKLLTHHIQLNQLIDSNLDMPLEEFYKDLSPKIIKDFQTAIGNGTIQKLINKSIIPGKNPSPELVSKMQEKTEALRNEAERLNAQSISWIREDERIAPKIEEIREETQRTLETAQDMLKNTIKTAESTAKLAEIKQFLDKENTGILEIKDGEIVWKASISGLDYVLKLKGINFNHVEGDLEYMPINLEIANKLGLPYKATPSKLSQGNIAETLEGLLKDKPEVTNALRNSIVDYVLQQDAKKIKELFGDIGLQRIITPLENNLDVLIVGLKDGKFYIKAPFDPKELDFEQLLLGVTKEHEKDKGRKIEFGDSEKDTDTKKVLRDIKLQMGDVLLKHLSKKGMLTKNFNTPELVAYLDQEGKVKIEAGRITGTFGIKQFNAGLEGEKTVTTVKRTLTPDFVREDLEDQMPDSIKKLSPESTDLLLFYDRRRNGELIKEAQNVRKDIDKGKDPQGSMRKLAEKLAQLKYGDRRKSVYPETTDIIIYKDESFKNESPYFFDLTSDRNLYKIDGNLANQISSSIVRSVLAMDPKQRSDLLGYMPDQKLGHINRPSEAGQGGVGTLSLENGEFFISFPEIGIGKTQEKKLLTRFITEDMNKKDTKGKNTSSMLSALESRIAGYFTYLLVRTQAL